MSPMLRALAVSILLLGPTVGAVRSQTEGSAPIVIAHRGASGYLPEHTLPSYALAYGMGAHYIEPDLVMTRDRVLVALHDIHLEATTNVEELFPERARADGRWYAADFSLEEIKRLQVHERTNERGQGAIGDRFRIDSKGFVVPTLVEILEMVQELNRLTGCRVGLYPETKDPAFHDRENLPMEEELLRILAEYGYRDRAAPVFVQSFDPANLKELRRELGSDLRLVQLVSAEQRRMLTDAGLDKIATYADGIGPSKRLIDQPNAGSSSVVSRAHARGLLVHPYTFRADDLPPGAVSFEEEVLRFVEELGVDGFFTDHPDRALQAVGSGVGCAAGG